MHIEKKVVFLVLLAVYVLVFSFSVLALVNVISPSSSPFITNNTSVQLNFSIDEASLSNMIYNWNGTNYTLYNDSLILMYNFNNNSAIGENSTYIVDASKYGNNGTVIGGAVLDSSGKYNGAMQFDGVDDYVTISDSSSFDFGTGAFSISMWFKKVGQGRGDIFNWKKDSGLQDDFGFILQDDETLDVFFRVDGSGDLIVTNGNVFSLNQWHQAVFVRDSGGNIITYIDGVSDGTGSSSANISNIDAGTPIWIGSNKDNGNPSNLFNGSIDEIRMWNRSLSASEIYQSYISNLNKINSSSWNLYINQSKNSTTGLSYGTYNYQLFTSNSSGGVSSTNQQEIIIREDAVSPSIDFVSPTFANNSNTLNTSIEINVSIGENNLSSLIYNWNGTNFTLYNSSLLLAYNFENSSVLGENSTQVVDISGNFRDMFCLGSACPTLNYFGKYGNSYSFDGGDRWSLVDASFLNGATKFTYSVWINSPVVGNSWAGIISRYSGDNDCANLQLHGDGRIYVDVDSGSASYGMTAIGTISANVWYHVVFVYNGAGLTNADKMKVYVNGVEKNLIFSGTVASYASSTTVPLTIGSMNNVAYYNGLIDEPRIWNRSLSATEIYQSYISNLNKINSSSWNLYVNQSKNTTSGLSNGVYDYQVFSTDNSGNINSTEKRTVTVTSDLAYPTFSNYSDNNVTLNNSGPGLFNVTLINTNGTVLLEVNGTNITATNLTANIYNVTYYFVSNGTYSYKWHSWGNGTNKNYNVSSTRVYNVNYLDTNYPTFSNYSDNNVTLINSGVGLFNTTVFNTNGTVLLNFNGINYTATNLSSNVYNVSVSLTSAGVYNYTWYAYGNGTDKLFNNSEIFSYVVNASSEENIVIEVTSSSGGGNYLSVQNFNSSLKLKVLISPNRTVSTKINQDKGTGLKEIELKSKNWLSGEVYVVAYNETPDFCSLLYDGDYKLYRVLNFNSSLNDSLIDFGRFTLGVEKDWIYSNNISEVKFVRCYPAYEEVRSSFRNETASEGVYDVYVNGFSAYAILGIFEKEQVSNESLKVVNTPNAKYSFIWLYFVLGIMILILLVVVLIKNRFKIIEHFHGKFIDIDLKIKLHK